MLRPCAPVVPAESAAAAARLAANLRRLMARQGLTIRQVAERARVYPRTVRSVLAGVHRPQARTLGRLAAGLGAAVDELFVDPALLARRAFDRATNPLVEAIVAEQPQLFAGWTAGDFDELYSRFGAGGGLTADGALAAVRSMNDHRRVHAQVAVILETAEAELLAGFVDLLYRRVAVSGG